MAETRSYRTLWVLLVVALLPLLAAVVMYFGGFGVPEGRTHHGQLMLDRPPLSQWLLQRSPGEPWRGQGKWQMLQVAERCDEKCLRWRYDLLQLHKALGRERDRVEPQWIGIEAPADLAVERSPLQWIQAPTPAVEPGVWVADPLGNLVLYYRFDQSPRDLLLDLKRLLKLSKVG